MTRYLIEIEVEHDGDLKAQDLDLGKLEDQFKGAHLVVSSGHWCPQCDAWHKAGKGNRTLVRDYDLWCRVCKRIVDGRGRGLLTSRPLGDQNG